MDQERFALWDLLVEDAIKEAERRLADERLEARRRAVQLSREQGYHRLAVAIDRPTAGKPRRVSPDQLSFFATEPTLFDPPDAG